MNAVDPIQGCGAAPQATRSEAGISSAMPSAPSASFGDMLAGGIDALDERVGAAQDMVRAFAVDSSIPIHQVTIALEEARLAVELAMQIRTRLVEGYRDIMNTQL